MVQVWCMLRNYVAHAEEMGSTTTVTPEFFLKPEAAVVDASEGLEVAEPDGGEIHHEVELVLRLGTAPQASMSDAEVSACVDAVAVALDLTDRPRQAAAKAGGRPWTRAKGFRDSAPVGPWHAVADGWDAQAWRLELTVDGEQRQAASTDLLVHPLPSVLRALAAWAPLRAGDLVFTGTPSGVGRCPPGAVLEARLQDARGAIVSSLEVRITSADVA